MGARLGQHFLFDAGILARIADETRATKNDVVLEIGPGKGTLTRKLAERAGRVVAIETDRALVGELMAKFDGTNVEIVHGDALKVPWPAASIIAGNIPYQITSPLIEKALTRPRPDRVVFLVQKEVADRIAAEPGSDAYGALSAGVQLVAEVERLFTLKPGAFKPPPKVESAVVRLTPKTENRTPNTEDEMLTRALIRLVFQRRRQQLQRSLREGYGLAADQVVKLLEPLDLDPAVRPEQLAPAQFLALARALASA